MLVRPLPRFQLFLRSYQKPISAPIHLAIASTAARHASSSPVTDKSRILEKPDRFRPPSHGRTRRRKQFNYGPSLSDHEREEQKTKWYPNMMPPEGTFWHWFIHDRTLHLFITLGTLFTLAGMALIQSFLHNTPYRDSLPSFSDFLHHPFSSSGKFVEVYKLTVMHDSEKVQANRQKIQDDVKKREEFKRAHGIDPGFVRHGWLARFGTVEQDAKQRAKEEAENLEVNREIQSPIAAETAIGDFNVDSEHASENADGNEETTERKRRRPVKKWLGIW